MKKSQNYCLLIFISIFFFSCNTNNEEFIDIGKTASKVGSVSDLHNIIANSTVTINNELDLENQTIDIPEGVTIEYGSGGLIINGSLNFTSSGRIADELLNQTLQLEGDVQLTDDKFKFTPSKWGIVQGETTSAIALENNIKLEKLMFRVNELGVRYFNIDKFDAYFEVTKVTNTTANQNFYPTEEAINLPSNFYLRMTNNTHLRIYPGGEHELEGGAIFAVNDGENIVVVGGHLHGDRDKRRYSADDSGLEGSHLFIIHSGRNITVHGVKFENGSKGVFSIMSYGFPFNDDYNPTKRVRINNCTFTNTRRMSIALTDARDVIIEKNTFINNGQPSINSDGGEVGYAINVEPYRARAADGSIIEYQRAFDVLIRGNTEINSRVGFVALSIGQDLTVEDNDIGTRVMSYYVSDSKIINNRFKAATPEANNSFAVLLAGHFSETVYNNKVYGNTISGYSIGVAMETRYAEIYNNDISDTGVGIQIQKSDNVKIYDNTIVTAAFGKGIASTNTYNNFVEITNNNITSSGFHAYLVNINRGVGEENNTILVDNNQFLGNRKATISNAKGITFSNNEVIGGIEVGNTTNVTVESNLIKPDESDGIRLYFSHTNTNILNNTIYEPTGAARYECINNGSTTPSQVTLSGNTCN